MKLSFNHYLPAPPEAVWSFITEPKLINSWSTALIETLNLGDRQEPGAIGETRQVIIPTPIGKIQIQEVIKHSQPPELLVYQIYQGDYIKYHQGKIHLTLQGEGTLLRWDVEYEFFLHGLEEYVRYIIEPQIQKSLISLANLVDSALSRKFNPSIVIDDSEELPELWQQVEQVLNEQKIMADRLEKAQDPKFWFTRVYQFVTENQIKACREGNIIHKGWVLRLNCRFHEYYYENLHCWLGESSGQVEMHWRRAFEMMEQGQYEGGDANLFLQGLISGISAHIEEDLPRVLAEVYLRHYASVCSYGRIRADYLLMLNILYGDANQLKQRLPQDYMPLLIRLVQPIISDEIQNDMMVRNFYNVPQQRILAFERGERLVNFITGWKNQSFR